MGCLSRVGCLVIVAGAAAAGYWLYGDRLPSTLATAAGRAADKVSDAAGALSDRSRTTPRDGAGSTSRASERAAERAAVPRLDWARVDTAAAIPERDIAALSKRDGPAFITITAPELAALLSAALMKQLPTSARDVQLALRDNQLFLRATVDVTELAGDGTLGTLLGIALSGRDTLQLGGTLEPLRLGVAQYRVELLRVKGIQVPPRMIPPVLGAFRRGGPQQELAPNGIGMALPKAVADLRITKGRLTLYKAVPSR